MGEEKLPKPMKLGDAVAKVNTQEDLFPSNADELLLQLPGTVTSVG